ncbi:hypothetical protein FKP32DRAFT_1678690 [Trametes sanguinea]|nr:hypothetical protein FKP32DRAFT_1678690 [Trametes sanguinea]
MSTAAITSILHSLGFPSLSSTLGAIYVGVVIGTMLYGLTVHQGYRYYKLYPKDRLFLKIMVSAIFLVETLHTVLWIYIGYHYLVAEAFNLAGTLDCHWTIRATFIVTSIAVGLCQTFYCLRIFLFGPRYRWLLTPAVLSMTAGAVFGIIAGVKAFVFVHEITELHRISWTVSAAYGCAVSSDVILTSALVYVLYKSRSESRRSNNMLDILIIYAINTGLLTSVVSVLAFVFALVVPGNLIYASVSIVGAKLYANSVLALLNSRKSIDDRFLDDFSSFNIPSEKSQANRSGIGSMVWNVRQRSTVMSQMSSIREGANFAAEHTSSRGTANRSGQLG